MFAWLVVRFGVLIAVGLMVLMMLMCVCVRVRALGIALVGNPDFAIVDEAYPYISRRLMTDQSPRLRAALRFMVRKYPTPALVYIRICLRVCVCVRVCVRLCSCSQNLFV